MPTPTLEYSYNQDRLRSEENSFYKILLDMRIGISTKECAQII